MMVNHDFYTRDYSVASFSLGLCAGLDASCLECQYRFKNGVVTLI